MKAVITAALIAALTLVLSGVAQAASDPRVPALQRKVAALTKAVLYDEDLSTCHWTYQSHINYGFLNLFEDLIYGAAQTADSTPSDKGACQRVGMNPPAYRSAASVKLDPFGSLVSLQLASQRIGR